MTEELQIRRQSLTFMGQGQWMQIQRTTFTNWVNEQLRPQKKKVKDIRTDFTDGVRLVTLVEALTSRPVPGALKRPSNKYQKLQNITKALEAVASDGIKMVNIDSKAVSEGNLKLILALVWLLVVRYQGGLGATQHRRWMMVWMKAVIPECRLGNFTTDWNDGSALLALLDFCKPGLAPDWKSVDKDEDGLDNCRKAMELAQKHFDIPLVLLPEDLSSPLLDEQSAILYLSYFTRRGGPGYNATRARLRERVKSRDIENFTTGWADGSALAELVTSCGGRVPGWPTDDGGGSDDVPSARELVHQALQAGKELLGIEPLLAAEEIVAAEETAEHMGLMAYTAQYIHKTTMLGGDDDDDDVKKPVTKDTSSSSTAAAADMDRQSSDSSSAFQLVRRQQPSVVKSGPNHVTTFYHSASSDATFRIDIYSVGVIMESKLSGQGFDRDLFLVEAEAPSGRVVRMCGDGQYSAEFTPDEIGRWRVAVYYNKQFMDGCPVDVCDPSQVRVRGLRGGHIGKPQTFHVDCTKAGQGNLGVDITHGGKHVQARVTQTLTPRLFKVEYTPSDPGPHEVNVHFNRAEVRDSDFYSTDPEERRRVARFKTTVTEEKEGMVHITASCDWEIDYVTGGPFLVHVTDCSDIEVYGMKDGTVCSNPELLVNCTKAGEEGTLTAEVTHQGTRYPCKVRRDENQHGVRHVTFSPRGAGLHQLWMEYDGTPIKGSPFLQEITEVGHPKAYGDGLYRGLPDTPQSFTVDPCGRPGPITAQVIGPSSRHVPCQLTNQNDGTFRASYVPMETGPHTVHIQLQGQPIEASPFKPFIVNLQRVTPAGEWRSLVSSGDVIPLQVDKEKRLAFDTSEAGLGEMTAEVRGPRGRLPVAIDARNDGKHTVIFTPREEGLHHIDVKWGGFSLVHSPYKGHATWCQPDNPVTAPEREVLSLRQIPLHRPPGPEGKDILPLRVDEEKQMVFDTKESGQGQLTSKVQGPRNTYLPVTVKDSPGGQSALIFTPKEQGKHLMHISWNGHPLSVSPYIGYALPAFNNSKNSNNNNNNIIHPRPVDIQGHSSPSRMKEEDKDIIPLTVLQENRIPFDASKAGPGRLQGTVLGPTDPVPCSVETAGDGTQPVLCFVPKEQGKHYIDVSWNGQPLAESPLLGFAISPDHVTCNGDINGLPSGSHHLQADPEVGFSLRSGSPAPSTSLLPATTTTTTATIKGSSPESWDSPMLKIVLSGRGLKEAEVKRPAMFFVDGSHANPGHPTCHLESHHNKVPVILEPIRPQVYRCSYVPEIPGSYKLYVKWNDKPLKGSPYLVHVRLGGGGATTTTTATATRTLPSSSDPFPPPSTPGGTVHPHSTRPGEDVELKLDHPDPSRLTVLCRDPKGHVIPCSFHNNGDGTRSVKMTPTMAGRHVVDIRHHDQHILGSPYFVDIKNSHVSEGGRVRVWGPGIHSGGVLSQFHSNFWVDTSGAGAGELRVRIVGPKGAFHVKLTKAKQRDKLYQCFYHPAEPGVYRVHVQWSGQRVEGSPFTVCLAHTLPDLDALRLSEKRREKAAEREEEEEEEEDSFLY